MGSNARFGSLNQEKHLSPKVYSSEIRLKHSRTRSRIAGYSFNISTTANPSGSKANSLAAFVSKAPHLLYDGWARPEPTAVTTDRRAADHPARRDHEDGATRRWISLAFSVGSRRSAIRPTRSPSRRIDSRNRTMVRGIAP